MSSDRQIVITGTSSGIGLAIAQFLLAQHWQVTGLDVAPPTLKDSRFTPVTLDLCDGHAVAQAAARVGAAYGLIHAAGVLRVGRVGALDAAAGDTMWRLHVAAASHLCDAIVPGMVQRRKGRVIFIGSRIAQGMAGRGQYAATKAALIAMARSWAAEVAACGMTVNVV